MSREVTHESRAMVSNARLRTGACFHLLILISMLRIAEWSITIPKNLNDNHSTRSEDLIIYTSQIISLLSCQLCQPIADNHFYTVSIIPQINWWTFNTDSRSVKKLQGNVPTTYDIANSYLRVFMESLIRSFFNTNIYICWPEIAYSNRILNKSPTNQITFWKFSNEIN